jgi:hypothetical protein
LAFKSALREWSLRIAGKEQRQQRQQPQQSERVPKGPKDETKGLMGERWSSRGLSICPTVRVSRLKLNKTSRGIVSGYKSSKKQ